MPVFTSHSILASMANGQLAAEIAKQACMPGAKAEVSSPSPGFDSDEESSDEEGDLRSRRQQAKDISRVAVANGCLPEHAKRPPTHKSPFASFVGLQNTMDVLGAIALRPDMPSRAAKKFTEAEMLEAELQVAKAFAEADALEAASLAASVADSPETSRPSSPAKPTGAKSTKLRPKMASSIGPKTDCLMTKQSSTKRAGDPCDLAKLGTPPLASKLAVPGTPPQSVKLQQRASMVDKCPMFFCMDASDDTSSGDASARDSSLARAYDVLGVTHSTLADADDLETCSAAGRESSIVRQFDVLGAQMGKSPSRPQSRSGRLPPVRSHSRGTFAPMIPGSTRGAPSAMEMDLGLPSDTSSGRNGYGGPGDVFRTGACTSPPQKRQAHSLGSANVFKTVGKAMPTIVLPSLQGSGLADSRLSTKSLFKMQSGSLAAPVWDVPSLRHGRQLDTRQLVF